MSDNYNNNNNSENSSKTKMSNDDGVIRNGKNIAPSLRDLQLDKAELERCVKSPAYFYNTYIRKEGQPVLSEEEYNRFVELQTKAIEVRVIHGRTKDHIIYEPIKPKDASN